MNKYKKLAANTAIFAIGSFGSKILAFLLTRIYTGYMDAGMFNTKEILEMCANLLIPVVSFSITDAVIRYGLDKNYEKKNVLSNAVTALLFGIGGFVLLSPLLLLYSEIRHYYFLLVGYICISCFRQVSTQFARARGLVKLYAADGIFCTLTFLLLNVLFIAGFGWGITGFMLATLLSDLLSGISVWVIANHNRYFSFRYVDKELLGVMLRFSLPLIPTAILWIITGFSDRLFIRYLVKPAKFGIGGATAAGVYGASSKIPNLLSMVSSVFYQAWNMSAIAENNSKERSRFYTQIFSAYQSILVLASAFIILLVHPLSNLLIDYGKDPAYRNAFLYTPMLVIAVLLMCLNQFLSSIYTVSKHTRNSFYTSLVAAVLNLLLNAILIPKYAVYGAIIATIVSYLACYLIRIIDTRRFIPFQVNHAMSLANLLLLGGMSLLIVFAPAYYYLWMILMLVAVLALNFRSLMTTAKKILRRG